MISQSNWESVRIGDLGRVITGRTPSTKRPEYFGEEFQFITPGDMHQGKHSLQTVRNLSPSGAELLERIQIPANSICVSCIGWQMGEVVMTTSESFTNQQINTIIPNESVDPDFLYYSMAPRKQELLSLGAGVGVRTPILNKSAFSNLKVLLPDLPTQKRISGILSAYDDLIENNLKRIRILEEMAQSLYREWFVHFRYPGHESILLVDSPLGPIPEGWEVKKLGYCCDLTMGQSPKSEFYNSDENGLPFHQGVTNFGDHFPTDKLFCTVSNRIAEKGDILFSVRAPVGRINVADKRIVIGRGVSAIRAQNQHQDFLYFQIKELFQKEDSIGNGAIFNSVTKKDMQEISLLLPHERLMSQFETFATPAFKSIKSLTARNQNLRQTRDLLLPKLLTPPS